LLPGANLFKHLCLGWGIFFHYKIKYFRFWLDEGVLFKHRVLWRMTTPFKINFEIISFLCVWWRFSSLPLECWRLVKDNVPCILWIFWIKCHSCHLQYALWRQVCMLLNTRERCVYLITVIYPTELGINDTTESCRNVSHSDVLSDIDNDVRFCPGVPTNVLSAYVGLYTHWCSISSYENCF